MGKQIDENITKNNRIPISKCKDLQDVLDITQIISTSTGSTVSKKDYEKYVLR